MLIADGAFPCATSFPDQAFLAGDHDCGVPLMRRDHPCKVHLGEPGRWIDLADEDQIQRRSLRRQLHRRTPRSRRFICDAIRYHRPY